MDELVKEIKSFNSKNKIVTKGSSLENIYKEFCMEIIKKSEEFQERDSGWALEKPCFLEINISKYNPLKASSFIELSAKIKSTKAVVNLQNDDEMCFLWAIVAYLYPAKQNPHRITSYQHYSKVLNINGLSFPMKLKDINIFEKLNNISVNVYGIEKNDIIIGPLYYTEEKKEKHVNLLYLEEENKSHYCLIKSLNRLLSSSLSKHNGCKWLCDGCLIYFRQEKQLKEHMLYDCNKIRTFLPDDSRKILKFNNIEKQFKVPFVIYADFESILKPINTCSPDDERSYMQDIHMHEPFSFAFYIKCSFDNSLNHFELYRGKECVKVFMNKLNKHAKIIYQILSQSISLISLNELEKQNYELAKICHICKKELDGDKVLDHDHFTGRFRGAAHNSCNLHYRKPDFIPVIVHNLSGYDSHFIIRELSNENIDVLANNMEKYISFTNYIQIDDKNTIKLRFIDSIRFLPSSLENLAKNLEDHQLKCVREFYHDENKFQLLRQKGVFPYEYVKDMKCFDEENLPQKSQFHNLLNSENISNLDYERAKTVWKEFNIKNLGEYSDLYLKSDVLLLSDIFENFREVCMRTYNLDPSHYYTLPGLGWDAMLKITDIELDLLTDIDMLNFVKNSIRGGLCQCVKKFSAANNKYIPNFNKSQESKFIVYLDANNLYGWAMSQYLPYKNFRWLEKREINELDITKVSDSNDKGYILEVDLEYPIHLHSLHNELPFCPQNINPPHTSSDNRKLIADLTNKKKYTIHYRNLKQCLSHGINILKIYRVLEFDQSQWMKPYIDLNNDLRTRAKNKFEKDNYKLLNNSVFGKAMENIDKRVDIKIITKWNDSGNRLTAERLIKMPHFNSRKIIHENLVIIKMNKTKVVYNKPIYLGFTILDISKLLMYDFHYDHIKKEYGDRSQLLYMDTDSFMYEIQTEDFYEDMKKNLDKYDTSDYDKNNIYNIIQVNKKVLGKFKDECAGNIILKYYGLKAKTYCYLTKDEIIKKVKGIKKNVIRNEINVVDFEKCLKDNSAQIRKKIFVIRSSQHRLYTELVNKIALRNNDDKRFIVPNKDFATLAWGHNHIDKFYFI